MQPLDMACEGVAVVNMVHCLFEAVDHRVYLMVLEKSMASCLAYRWMWWTPVLCRKQSHLYVPTCNRRLVVC